MQIDTSRDLPGKVHGIVSLDPPTVRCDGCGCEFSHDDPAFAVLYSGIEFNGRLARSGEDARRLCVGCRKDAGWDA